jgi:hypothetical protein
VDLYARVRRAFVVDEMSEREAAKLFGLTRETVRKMLRYSVPPCYRRRQPARGPKLGASIGTVDQILEQNKAEGKKQSHIGQADLRAAARRTPIHGRLSTNDYSVPVEWGHREMLVKGFVHEG